jgi:hypothetical protein
MFAAIDRDAAQAIRGDAGDGDPEKGAQEFHAF